MLANVAQAVSSSPSSPAGYVREALDLRVDA